MELINNEAEKLAEEQGAKVPKLKTVQVTTVYHNVDEGFFQFLASQLKKDGGITNDEYFKIRRGEKIIAHKKDTQGILRSSTFFLRVVS